MGYSRARPPDRFRRVRLGLAALGLALGLAMLPTALTPASPSDEVALGVAAVWWLLACDPAGWRHRLPPGRRGLLLRSGLVLTAGVVGLLLYSGYLEPVAPVGAPGASRVGPGPSGGVRPRVVVGAEANPLVTARVHRIAPDLTLELEGGERVWLGDLFPYEEDPAIVRAVARRLEDCLLGQVVTLEVLAGVEADLALRAGAGFGPRVECRIHPPGELDVALPPQEEPTHWPVAHERLQRYTHSHETF